MINKLRDAASHSEVTLPHVILRERSDRRISPSVNYLIKELRSFAIAQDDRKIF